MKKVKDLNHHGFDYFNKFETVDLLTTCEQVQRDLHAAIKDPQQVYVKWFITELDKFLGGIRSPSADLWIISGASASGKTAVLLHTALENVLAKVPIGLMSLELSKKDVVHKMAVSQLKGRYTNHEVRKGFDINGEQIDTLSFQKVLSTFANAPLYINDEGGLDIQQVKHIARHWKQQYDIKVLMIDYLQLIEDSTTVGHSDQTRISSISRKLKALAKELTIPIIAVSTLSQSDPTGSDGRYHTSHLSGHGSIEYDADYIMILYRPWRHMISSIEDSSGYPAVKDTRYLIQAQIEKNRSGPLNIVNIWADLSSNRFFDA